MAIDRGGRKDIRQRRALQSLAADPDSTLNLSPTASQAAAFATGGTSASALAAAVSVGKQASAFNQAPHTRINESAIRSRSWMGF